MSGLGTTHDTTALATTQLSKRYGRGTWALQDCTLALPAGRVAALVGPNGAGKTTLLHLAVGLLRPSAGRVEIFGVSPTRLPTEVLARIGFVAQDHPLYHSYSVADLLTLGRKLNPSWDQQVALAHLDRLGIPLSRPAGKLSGGQQAQVALALALGKRPDLLLLDEPLASLDPLARRDFLAMPMDATAESGLTVLLSSHILSDLERVCDYLILLSAARVQLAGDIEEIVRAHKRLVGPRTNSAAVASLHDVIEEAHTDRQTTLLVRVNGRVFDRSWEIQDVALEEIVLGYMSHARLGQSGAQRPIDRDPLEVQPALRRVREGTSR